MGKSTSNSNHSNGRRSSLATCLAAAVGLSILAVPAAAQDKVTYDDHIVPILRNNCFKCHNPDKSKADLDLTTYSSVLKGGGSGKAVVPGDPDGSRLLKVITWAEEPNMPENGQKLPDAEIEQVRKWIAGGLLEKANSKALAASKPKVALMTGSGAKGRPAGPPVLPTGWRLDPVCRTERTNSVMALAASPWWPVIAVGGQGQLLFYQSDTLDLLGVLPFPEGNAACLQFSRDGRLLVAGWGHGAKLGFADVFDVATGERITRVGNEFDTALAADLNSDQTQVALGGPGKRVKVYSAQDGRLLHDLKKHTDWVTAIQFSPDSVLLATGDRNGGLMVWEADGGQELYTLAGHQQAISSVSWRDDSEALLSASEDGSIRVWEMREGRQVANWNAHKEGVLDARFGHDGRIVSCGRDRQVAIWDAGGKKLRSWVVDGDLPVRATFTGDGSNVLAGSWLGRVTSWSAADGKLLGGISPNPMTLQERLDLAQQEVQRYQGVLAEKQEAVVAAESEAKKAADALKAHDRTSPTFEFITAHAQAQAAHRKAAEEAGKALEQLRTVAAKSAGELAAAEAEAGKLQAALDKVDKFSGPYKELARQSDAANQKLAAATNRSVETAMVLSEKTAAVNAATADLQAKLNSAAQVRDKAAGSLAESEKQFAASNQKLTAARSAAEQDKSRLSEQQAVLNQAMTSLTTAETEAASLAQALKGADTNSPAGQELAAKAGVAAKMVAEATAAHQRSQKAFGNAKTLAEKSASTLATAEADATKLKSEVEAVQKTMQAATDALKQAEVAKATAVESARKEIETLQSADTQAKAALESARAETAGLQVKIGQTEKFSDAFKEATQRLEAASKQVSNLRVPADRDGKEVADLQGALEKIKTAAATAEAEAVKAIATMASNDPSYRRCQELEKALEQANKKVEEARTGASNASQEVERARSGVARVKQAQHQTVLCLGRETIVARQEENVKVSAALDTARSDSEKAAKALADARAALAGQPTVIAGEEARVVSAWRRLTAAQAVLKQASRDHAGSEGGVAALGVLIEKQNVVQEAVSELDAAREAERSARKQLDDLRRSIKPLTDAAHSAAARLTAAEVAAAKSGRELAAAKEHVDKLAAARPPDSAR